MGWNPVKDARKTWNKNKSGPQDVARVVFPVASIGTEAATKAYTGAREERSLTGAYGGAVEGYASGGRYYGVGDSLQAIGIYSPKLPMATPGMPTAPGETPEVPQVAGQAEANRRRRQQAGLAGRRQTILTGPGGLGDTEIPGQRRTLLG